MSQKTYRREELASYLITHSDQVMQRWEGEVRATGEAFKTHERLALKNNLADVLSDLALILRGPDEVHTKGQAAKALQGHQKLRATFRQYSLAQLLGEYNVLRLAI